MSAEVGRGKRKSAYLEKRAGREHTREERLHASPMGYTQLLLPSDILMLKKLMFCSSLWPTPFLSFQQFFSTCTW